MKDKDKSLTDEHYAVIKIPSDHLPRFIHLPSSAPGRKDLIMLDDIVRHSVKSLFPGYKVQDTYSIKLTRDAELYIDDEFSGDLVGKIKHSLSKRNVGPPSRLVIDREMPNKLLEFLIDTYHLYKAFEHSKMPN
jgi:polyphosphate kinase